MDNFAPIHEPASEMPLLTSAIPLSGEEQQKLGCRSDHDFPHHVPNVEHSRIESLKLISTYMGWGDLPMYDSGRYILPSAQMKANGVIAEYLKLLGPWIAHDAISGVGKLIKETIEVLPSGSNWPLFLNDLADEAQRLNPKRWTWLSQQPKSQLDS